MNENLWDPSIPPFPPYPDGFQYHDAVYLIFTTITTIGYGDYSPKTVIGRVLLMLMILSALVLVPKETNKLIAILANNSVYRRQKYKVSKFTSHVLICGEMREGVVEFFKELFHPDHGIQDRFAVVIAKGAPSPEVQMVRTSSTW